MLLKSLHIAGCVIAIMQMVSEAHGKEQTVRNLHYELNEVQMVHQVKMVLDTSNVFVEAKSIRKILTAVELDHALMEMG